MLGCMFMAYFQESDVCQAMCPIGNGQAYIILYEIQYILVHSPGQTASQGIRTRAICATS